MPDVFICRRGASGRCRDPLCQKPIAWVILTASGKRHPIDEAPAPDGNIAITGNSKAGRQAVVLSRAARESRDGPLYVSHFATCAAAERFRR